MILAQVPATWHGSATGHPSMCRFLGIARMIRRLEPITVPIALSRTRSATITLPWFVQGTAYPPEQCTFTPLVNGEEAFRDVYNTIAAAQHSVDIICWGFQPSMFFRRGADGQGTDCIGDLLERVGKRGVRVRVLC